MLKHLILVLFVCYLPQSQCECRHSFVTFCDDLKETVQLGVETWTELIIGMDSNKTYDQMYVIDYNDFPLHQFWKLKTLMIIGQIKDIKTSTFSVNPEDVSLQMFKIYGNNIEQLRTNTFEGLELNTLSFVNNNLRFINNYAFTNCKIITLDLSYNNLEIIESDTINKGTMNNNTYELILSHNKIVLIEPNALPRSLEYIDLSHNRLVRLAKVIFKKLTSLIEIFLSHNLLTEIPDFSTLYNLKELRLSHNQIKYINPNYLRGLEELEILDLSYNRLHQFDLLTHLQFRRMGLPTQISLAFNRYTKMQLINETLADHYLILYGNPWNCRCWQEIEEFIVNNEFKRNKCDLKAFGDGQIPYCMHLDDAKDSCSEKKQVNLTQAEYEGFITVIEGKVNNLMCSLNPIRM